jgi:hypothetical protein
VVTATPISSLPLSRFSTTSSPFCSICMMVASCCTTRVSMSWKS